MEKNSCKIILILLFSTAVFAQSTERFIRIIGNAKKEIQADKARVFFAINEVSANKYKDVEQIEYKDVYKDIVLQMHKVSIDTTKIIESSENVLNSHNTNYKVFYYDMDITDIGKFKEINHDGFRVKEVNYLYNQIDDNLESDLSLKAISDAKRKAKTICNDIKMRLGNILNIEIKENNVVLNKVSKEKISLIVYKVTITFELKD